MVGELDVSSIVPSLGSDVPAPLFARQGPAGSVPPRHRSYAALRLLVAPSTLAIPRVGVPDLAPEATRSPRFLGSPCIHADVSDPGEPARRGSRASPCVLTSPVLRSAALTASACTTMVFRDSIHRPACPLSTLRSAAPCSVANTTQDSLPPSDLPLTVGTFTRGLLFGVSGRYLLPLRPGFSWRTKAHQKKNGRRAPFQPLPRVRSGWR